MGTAVEGRTTAGAKSGPIEVRANKIVKKSRDKKCRGLDVDAVLEAVEQTSPGSDDTQDARDKKGIVIDGKTYTCATCKTGHRVGICKHARERPMTATHPPGRPPAGAPKKIVCDCPKQCSCKKRDCKCARNCSCTQMMYMLVYVPAPGEDENAQDEKGAWKLGQQVTTDLKGNILTTEQIRERQEQKEAQKTFTPTKRTSSTVTGKGMDLSMSTLQGAEPKPKEVGGCCKHKENVATRNIVAEASPQTGRISKSAADGCNCGHTCDCAFCPQHPNNSTSINMARQQAMHFANQHFEQDPQSIVSFVPTMPQEISCMGGLPQFAISSYAQRPSFHDLQRTFPHPGYVIGYPIYSNRHDSAGIPASPFAVPHFASNIGMQSPMSTPLPTPHLGPPQPDFPPLQFSQDEFGVGNAFVASAGPGGWNENVMSPTIWPMESVPAPVVNHFMEPDFLPQVLHEEVPISTIPHNAGFEFLHDVDGFGDTYDIATATVDVPIPEPALVPRRSCCASTSNTPFENHGFDYFPAPTPTSPAIGQP